MAKKQQPQARLLLQRMGKSSTKSSQQKREREKDEIKIIKIKEGKK